MLHLPSTSQLGNLILKVSLLIITFLCTNSLLTAREPTTDPKILCSQPKRKELVLQFKKMGLDTKFVSDFCQRFAQDQIEIRPREKTTRGLVSIKQIWAANQLQGEVALVPSDLGQINSVETISPVVASMSGPSKVKAAGMRRSATSPPRERYARVSTRS